MTIGDWEGVALIIGSGDIGNCFSDYLASIAPRLDIFVCGRNSTIQNNIYLDLENDESFSSFVFLLFIPIGVVFTIKSASSI